MPKTKRKQQSFVYGAIIMVVSTALVKVIGAIFKIPLGNLIDESGMGYFTTAYNLYLPIYALAMAGLPIAVSRIVAEQIAIQRYKDVRQTLRVAKKAFFITGLTGSLVMLALIYPFLHVTGNYGAAPSIFMILPSIFFCCIMSAYRGYYEGLRNMYPTAVSSIIEALGKLVLGYGFAYAIIKYYGGVTLESASYAAAGAMLGITLGTVFGALYLIIRHRRTGDQISPQEYYDAPRALSQRKTLRRLIAIAIPVVLGSLVTNIASLIDVTMVQWQLGRVVDSHADILNNAYGAYFTAGMTNDDIPNFLYGCYQYAYTIFNLIPTITSVLGVSALPVLATSWTQRDQRGIKTNVETMIRTTALIAMPAGIGITALAGPIMELLYDRPGAVTIGTPLLAVLGLASLFAGLMSPMTNMLQAIGKERIPVRNIAVGASIKIIVNLILVGIPEINIMGAPIGTLCCYVYISMANLVCIIKYSGVRPNLFSALGKPLISALICAIAAFAVVHLLGEGSLFTLIAIGVAGVVYVVCLILFRAFTEDDILTLPKGEKIAKVLKKCKILR